MAIISFGVEFVDGWCKASRKSGRISDAVKALLVFNRREGDID